MREPKPFEPCPMPQRDCAALDDLGCCRALTKIRYSQAKPCPFYKSKDQNDAEREKCFERLVLLGRFDLLNKYKDNPSLEEPDEEQTENPRTESPAISQSNLNVGVKPCMR